MKVEFDAIPNGFLFELSDEPKVAPQYSPAKPAENLPSLAYVEAPPPPLIDWTFMVYLGGDNNLAEEMVYALKGMLAVGSTPQCQIYVLYDAGLRPLAIKVPDRAKLKALKEQQTSEFQELKSESTLAAAAFEGPLSENTGIFTLTRPARKRLLKIESVQATLEKFMKSAIADSPAKSYALVLSGHGSGSVTDFLGAEKRFNGISVQDLGETLSKVTEYFSKPQKPPIFARLHLLGMDSCQMSTGEVASEVMEYVDLLVGAEGFEPNTGWPYDLVLARLNQETADHPSKDDDELPETRKAVAAGVVSEYLKFYTSDYAIAEISTDMSAVDLQAFKDVTDLLSRRHDGLVDLMIEVLRSPDERLDARLSPEVDAIVMAHWEAQGYKNEQNVDLWDFCHCLGERSARFKPVCAKLKQAIEALVFRTGYCGPAFQHSHGLSVYFPWHASIDAAGNDDIEHYKRLEFSEAARWGEFLRAYTEKTQRPSLNPNRAEPSALNRRDDLFTGAPFSEDGTVEFKISVADAAAAAKYIPCEGALKIVNQILEVRKGSIGEESVENKAFLIESAELSIPSGKLRLDKVSRLGAHEPVEGLSIIAGAFKDHEAEKKPERKEGNEKKVEKEVEEEKLHKIEIKGELRLTKQILMIDDDKLTVTGSVSIHRGALRMKNLEVRNDQLASKAVQLAVRGGKIAIDEGVFAPSREPGSIRRGPLKDVSLRVRNERITTQEGLVFFQGRLMAASEVRAKDSVRALSAKDSVRALSAKDSVRALSAKDSVRGVGGSSSMVKIASMKNPPVVWAICDLLAKDQAVGVPPKK